MVGIRFGNILFLFGVGCNYWVLCYYFCTAASATICQALRIPLGFLFYFVIGSIIVARLYCVQTFRLRIQDLAQTVLAFSAFEYDRLHVVTYHCGDNLDYVCDCGCDFFIYNNLTFN
jgi:hypothetical protein